MNETPEVTQMPQGVESDQKVPYALLEVLVYGIEENKKDIKKMMEKIQDQMSKAKRGKYARILWYIDKGEKTDEEKREWLLEKSNAKYTVFAPKDLKPKFISDVLIEIRKYENSITKLKTLGVTPSKKKNERTQNINKAD